MLKMLGSGVDIMKFIALPDIFRVLLKTDKFRVRASCIPP